MEGAQTIELCGQPLHPYTTSLISAIPQMNPSRGVATHCLISMNRGIPLSA
ncbi:MAG: peptide ABC transporter substrate-binding protein, partial [Candidatus Dormibacteraceae bacterium]